MSSIRIITTLLFLAVSAPAQTETAPAKPKGSIQVKFLAEVVPEGLGNTILASEKSKSAPFALPTNFLSEPVAVTERAFKLTTEAKGIALCSVALPESGNQFAVILVTAKPAGYQPIVVRTDDPEFKAGDVFFINRSGKTVLGKLGTTALVLKPGESTRSRPSGPRDNAFYDIAFATREETGDKLISSTRWPIDQGLRSYVIFFTNAQGKTTFRAIDEYLTPPAEKP